MQFVPAGAASTAQARATLPVNPFSPFTTMMSVTLVPTLVAMFSEFALTEKSFTERVALEFVVFPMAAALIVTVELPAGVVPKIEVHVMFERLLGVTPGVTTGGVALQETPAIADVAVTLIG